LQPYDEIQVSTFACVAGPRAAFWMISVMYRAPRSLKPG